MNFSQIAQAQLASARKSGALTTNIALVLFAALIVSWLGMSDHVNKYRSAVASKLWAERQNRLAEDTDRKILGEAVKGSLLYESLAYEDKDTRKKIISLAKSAANDPEVTLGKLQKDTFEARLLAAAIEDQRRLLSLQRRQTSRRFYAKRAPAEKTPFKLLGLDFSVDGFWAWNVWMCFLAGGVFLLWIGRRGIIRRHREVWRLLSSDEKFPTQPLSLLADSLPIWARPFSPKERWSTALTNEAKKDLVQEPLSSLCLVLMLICIALSFAVTRMSVVSTSLLGQSRGAPWNSVLHSLTLCVVCGFTIGLLLTWGGTPDPKEKTTVAPGSTHAAEVRILGRRAWLASAMGMGGIGFLYLPFIKDRLLRSILQSPRFHQEPNALRKRIRRAKCSAPMLKEGFYADSHMEIHYVPTSGRSRSLSGKLESDLQPWKGPFDKETLQLVHPSAIVPFVRSGVAHLLHGLRHRRSAEERTKLLAAPATRRLYEDAFELVLAGISKDDGRRTSRRMPNFQLYDLLAAVAINAQSNEFLDRASNLLKKADLPKSQVPSHSPSLSYQPSSTPHSHHSARKKKFSSLHRRQDRLALFKEERIGKRRFPFVSSEVAPSLKSRSVRPGTWTFSIRPEVANNTHVVRQRKKLRNRKRRHRQRKI